MGLSTKNITLIANECQIEITLYGPPAGNSNSAEDEFEDVCINRKTEYRHANLYGIIPYRPKDFQRFISPTDRAPNQLIVQATQEVYDSHPASDWRGANITGNVPMVLRISERALACPIRMIKDTVISLASFRRRVESFLSQFPS